MPASNPVYELNLDVARKINAEARQNPQSPYAKKWVGIANGKVAVIADDPDEMFRLLEQIEPDRRKVLGVEASRDYSEVIEIWRLC